MKRVSLLLLLVSVESAQIQLGDLLQNLLKCLLLIRTVPSGFWNTSIWQAALRESWDENCRYGCLSIVRAWRKLPLSPLKATCLGRITRSTFSSLVSWRLL
uniref:Secreted protein n=1 Tax=Opuntia streptacantha TaxID=393608 RepID=A0A7C9EZ05_OPUST